MNIRRKVVSSIFNPQLAPDRVLMNISHKLVNNILFTALRAARIFGNIKTLHKTGLFRLQR